MTLPLRTPLAMIAGGLIALAIVVLGGVVSATGGRVDRELMLAWAYDDLVIGPVGVLVRGPLIVVVLAAIVGVALLRRRPDLAVAAVVLVGGATVSTQLLKRSVIAPLATGENTMPSGHVTVVLSTLLAAVLVSGPRWRPQLSALAGFLGAVTAIGAMIGTWHVPGDVVAAAAVCLVWAGIVVLIGAPVARRFHRTAAVRWSSDPALRPPGLALLGGLAAAGALTAYRGWPDIPLGWFVASRFTGMLVALAVSGVVSWFVVALDEVDQVAGT
ncbi:PAP2 superfamily protein [Branchiibius hedensis]|uniref:PAP2 superfamily protein n=1 Tax=Branchiibius hedensis TaxID=672460 RepID=A0A2Y8ZSW7_9MICO|nr:phosphatase PAP2 family protein [Branchiibius hedensis]PWJ26173.1 PAP2 superfamily protein [Branchiibius hedensis]SSA34985.1 PAP2 superfamily protein [Branchiibius hedensis]